MTRTVRHLEAQHGRALIAWADRMAASTDPELRWLFHVPNGLKLGGTGSTPQDRRVAAMRSALAKAEGLRKGIFDYHLPFRSACGAFTVLWIELKSPDVEADADGGLSQDQRDFGSVVAGQGARIAVCFRWTEAAAVILNHLRNPQQEPRRLAPFAEVDVKHILRSRTPRLLAYEPRKTQRRATTARATTAATPTRNTWTQPRKDRAP